MRLRREAVDMIKEICSRYKNEPSPLMLVLSDVQKEYGPPKDHKLLHTTYNKNREKYPD